MTDVIDMIGSQIKPAYAVVHSIPRFWDYLDTVTPKQLRAKSGVGTILGCRIVEDVTCPHDQIWFMDRHGKFLTGIDINPEPPILAVA